MSSLRQRVASGMAWNMGEKIASLGVQGVVSVVLMRYLGPVEIAPLAIPIALLPIALSLVDGGFSQALIRKAEVTGSDLRAVFRFNLLCSGAICALLLMAAVPLAQFFDVPAIGALLPALLIVLPLNALGSVQNALLTRELRFARQSRIQFVSNCAAAAMAIALLFAGAGVWAVVGQRATMMAMRTAMLWRGRRGVFQGEKGGETAALRAMRPYSLRLMTTELVISVSDFLPRAVVVKLSSQATVGYFDQSRKILTMVSDATKAPVQSVSFPALASVSDEEKKFAESYRQLLVATAFVVFPLVAGLIVVAPALFAGLLGARAAQWLPIVPYLRVALIGAFFAPLSMVAYNVLKVKTNGREVLRWVIIKKAIALLALILSAWKGAMALMAALAIVSAIELTVDLVLARRHVALSLAAAAKALIVPALLSAAMAFAIYQIGMVPWPPLVLLLVQVLAGAGLYAVLACLVKSEGFLLIGQIVGKR